MCAFVLPTFAKEEMCAGSLKGETRSLVSDPGEPVLASSSSGDILGSVDLSSIINIGG